MVVLFITDGTFVNSFILTDSLTPLMRKHVKKKVPFRNRRFCRCTHNSGSKLYNCTHLIRGTEDSQASQNMHFW